MSKKKKIIVDYTATWGREFIVDEDATDGEIDDVVQADWDNMLWNTSEAFHDLSIESNYDEKLNDDLRKKGALEITEDDEVE